MSIEKDLGRIATALEIIAETGRDKDEPSNPPAYEPDADDDKENDLTEPVEPESDEGYTEQDVRKAVQDLQKAVNKAENNKTSGPAKVKSLLKKMKVASVTKMASSEYARAIHIAEKATAKAEGESDD